MPHRRIDLIINRTARHYQQGDGLLDRVVAIAEGRCRTHVTGNLDELDELCRDLSREGTDLVLLAGGDGTLMAGVSALARHFDSLPAVAPIPSGTACTVARNWGLYLGAPTATLERLLEGPRRLVPRPSLRVLSHDGATTIERIGFIVGTGLIARFFRLYYQRGAPGYAGSARLVSRIFAESFVGGPTARRVLEPLPCRLSVDGEQLAPRAWSLVCVAVVPNLGIHMLLTYRGGEDAARPHCVATPMPPAELGPRAPLVLSGRSLGGADLVDQLVETLAIDFDGGGPWVIDGELLHAERVAVSAGPVLTVATP